MQRKAEPKKKKANKHLYIHTHTRLWHVKNKKGKKKIKKKITNAITNNWGEKSVKKYNMYV